jgi:hypothetical protein
MMVSTIEVVKSVALGLAKYSVPAQALDLFDYIFG